MVGGDGWVEVETRWRGVVGFGLVEAKVRDLGNDRGSRVAGRIELSL